MTFYILFEGEKKENLIFDANILGEVTEKMFYPSKGFSRLARAIDSLPVSQLEKIQMFDEQGKDYTIEQFLKVIGKLTITRHN